MADNPSIADLYVGYTFVPSDQMVLRRYRPLNRLRSYFEDGLFSYNLSEFKDKEEGRLVEAEKDAEKAASRNKSKSGIRIDPKAIPSRQKQIREKYFANCMRAGTDEDPCIWKEYVDEDMKDGVALEMTFGGLRQQLPSDCYHRYAGMCWYVDRSTKKRPWREAPAICLLKGKKHKSQREFRLLSRYDSNDLTYPDDWVWPDSEGQRPTYGDNPWVKLSIDTGTVTDRIILAPEADQGVYREVEKILSDNDLDIPIVKSQLEGGPELGEAHRSDARVGAQRAFFDKDDRPSEYERYYNGFVERWIGGTDFSEFPVVDVVERCWFGLSILERHSYPATDPELHPTDYFHDDVPYATLTHRYTDIDEVNIHKNDKAKEKF